jgi:hypothetical protein
MKNSIKSIRTPNFNHKQDPDGKDGSLLGDHGRAEAEDLPTTRRMKNTIQMPTRHDRNLSGPFLRQNEIDQIHSRDVIRINGHKVSLVTARTQPAVPRAEVSSAPAYFAKKTILTLNSITMCLLRAPEIIRGTMSPGNVSVDGSEQFMRTSNCHPWPMAIVDVKEDGLIRAGVMNTLDQPDRIQSGQQYGQVTLTCEVNEAHSLQARLPTIRPRSSPTSTPTTLTDATLQRLSVNSSPDTLAADRQMAPQSRYRPRNNQGRHLTATREEPKAPYSGGRIYRSHARGSHRLPWSPERPLPVGQNLFTTRGQP